MWQFFIAEVRELLWLALIVCGLSIAAIVLGLAVSGTPPMLLFPI